jgi:Na+-driven multidrug efflux pump
MREGKESVRYAFVAATNLMAIAIANRNQNQAVDILSDAVGIALVLGVLFGVGTYLACPSILRAMTGSSSDVLGPAISYVQIRYTQLGITVQTTDDLASP